MLKLSPLCYPKAMFVLKKKINVCEMVWDILLMLQHYLDQLLCKTLLASFLPLFGICLSSTQKKT